MAHDRSIDDLSSDPFDAPNEGGLPRSDIPKGLGDLFGFSDETKGIFGALSNSLSEIAAGFGADVKNLQLGRSLEDARARINAIQASSKTDEEKVKFNAKLIGDFNVGMQAQKRSKEQTQKEVEGLLPGSSPSPNINENMFS